METPASGGSGGGGNGGGGGGGSRGSLNELWGRRHRMQLRSGSATPQTEFAGPPKITTLSPTSTMDFDMEALDRVWEGWQGGGSRDAMGDGGVGKRRERGLKG